MNGQSFTFWGYLPIESKERSKRLRELEKLSKQYNQTQIFIETPYRNDQMLQEILRSCNNETQLCIASNITAETELIKTRTIASWKKNGLPNVKKIPTVFYLLA
jgi:16S rRNA (cytidine1402-2'-O)-methyltransferase